MPQLDLINWFLIFFVLLCGIIILGVSLIKIIFYSWNKIIYLKIFLKLNQSAIKSSLLFLISEIKNKVVNFKKKIFTELLYIRNTLIS